MAACLLALQLSACAHGAMPAPPAPSPCADRAAARVGVDFVDAVARQMPAVVSVLAIATQEPWDIGRADAQDRLPIQWSDGSDRSMASGFVIGEDGYILTNEHAVAGSRDVSVKLADGRRFRAAVVGTDQHTDVALLKIAAIGLPVAAIASHPVLCPGEPVAALGSPLGFEQSVTAGVVSASPRFLNGGGVPLIQTDVALNPGSSGGPMFNRAGEVVAMNSMIYTTNGGYAGISLSLPIELAMQVAAQLRATGHVARARIGAHTQAVTPELAEAFGLEHGTGALVTRVDPGGPAALAGLRAGDIVVGIDGANAASYADIQDRVAAARPGRSIELALWRRRALLQLKLVPVEAAYAPPPRPAARAADQDPRLGLVLGNRSESGVYVRAVTGAARRAGIRPGDQVLGIEDTPVSTPAELDAALSASRNSDVVAVLILRGSLSNYMVVERRGPG
ncbi:MAG TPA: trypsin-like peptidase domain-containing protein [Variovorax sp.]